MAAHLYNPELIIVSDIDEIILEVYRSQHRQINENSIYKSRALTTRGESDLNTYEYQSYPTNGMIWYSVVRCSFGIPRCCLFSSILSILSVKLSTARPVDRVFISHNPIEFLFSDEYLMGYSVGSLSLQRVCIQLIMISKKMVSCSG